MACETTCNKCFEDWISCGAYDSEIVVKTGLDAGDYTVIFTDKFDHKYVVPVTVTGSGDFSIPLSAVPEGLFNEFAGVITMEMLKNNCEKAIIPVLDGYDYIDVDCIEITVKGGNSGKMSIGCQL